MKKHFTTLILILTLILSSIGCSSYVKNGSNREFYYKQWITTPNPNLAGQTPVQASRKSSSKEALLKILNQLQMQEELRKIQGKEYYDILKLKIRLGLLEEVKETVAVKESADEKIKTASTEYIIGPEDVIEVSIWKNEDLSRTVTVRPDGIITLPLINDVIAGGKSATELRGEIQTKLKEFIDDPEVTVSVVQFNSSKIFILGEVARPGVYQIKSNTSILQAISLAGGFNDFASKEDILIVRKNGKKTRELRFNYNDIVKRGKIDKDILLKKGDTIIVP